jgi:hypothetical protein
VQRRQPAAATRANKDSHATTQAQTARAAQLTLTVRQPCPPPP